MSACVRVRVCVCVRVLTRLWNLFRSNLSFACSGVLPLEDGDQVAAIARFGHRYDAPFVYDASGDGSDESTRLGDLFTAVRIGIEDVRSKTFATVRLLVCCCMVVWLCVCVYMWMYGCILCVCLCLRARVCVCV